MFKKTWKPLLLSLVLGSLTPLHVFAQRGGAGGCNHTQTSTSGSYANTPSYLQSSYSPQAYMQNQYAQQAYMQSAYAQQQYMQQQLQWMQARALAENELRAVEMKKQQERAAKIAEARKAKSLRSKGKSQAAADKKRVLAAADADNQNDDGAKN